MRKQPRLPRFLHHALNLTSVIPLFRPLFAPVLIAPVLGVCSRYRGSASDRLGACAEATVQPTPAFTLDGELRTRRT